MIRGLVCARAGSQGLPGKNLKKLGGLRLIEHAILKAWRAGCDDVVVTTDYTPSDFDLMDATYHKRPEELCGPLVSKWCVYRDAIGDADAIVDVDVTRPLSTADTVGKCIAALGNPVMAIALSDKHPEFDLTVTGQGGVRTYSPSNVVARQQLGAVYQHAGCYAVTRDALFSRARLFDGMVTPVVVDRRESFDIDDELDWKIVEALYHGGA